MKQFQFSDDVLREARDLIPVDADIKFDDILRFLAADVDKQRPIDGRRYHHHKRGSDYTLHAKAILNVSTTPPQEGDIINVYVADEDGRICARKESEFNDGRFSPIDNGGDPNPFLYGGKKPYAGVIRVIAKDQEIPS